MICDHCRKGADLAFAATKRARRLHARCEGCDCQHRLDVQLAGKAVQRDQLAPLGTINQVVE